MTKFFEIDERDGPARIGKLYIYSNGAKKEAAPFPFIQTPFLIDSAKTAADDSYLVKNLGTLWNSGTDDDRNAAVFLEKIQKSGDGQLLILPRNQFTLTYSEEENEKRRRKIFEQTLAAELVRKRPTAAMIRPIRYSKKPEPACVCGETSGVSETEINSHQPDFAGENEFVDENEFAGENEFVSDESASDDFTAENEFAAEKTGCDVYIMESAGTFDDDAIGFFEAFRNVKERLPADSALWLPNLATPENVAVLIYLGADLLDTTRAEIAAFSGKYMTAAGTFFLEDMTELPCRCAACFGKTAADLRGMPAADKSRLLREHNIAALEAEMSLVREKIRRGALREYVEGQCRTRTWLTGLIRLFDRSQIAEIMAPAFRRNTIYATTSESQNRAEIQRFARRIVENYEPPKKEILVIFPCSSKKPYSISASHQRFIQSIERNRRYVNELIITSPMGIIPRELELTYPAAHYDTTVTGHWDLEERAWVGGLLETYLLKNKNLYKHIIAHVDGAYREICEDVAGRLGLSITYTVEKSPASQTSLKNLRMAVDKIVEEATPKETPIPKETSIPKEIPILTESPVSTESPTPAESPVERVHKPRPLLLKRSGNDEKLDQAKAIARYQLGPLADSLFTKETTIKGNFPKFMLLDGKTQLAVLVPQFGQLAFSIAAAEKLIKSADYSGQYTVTIDDFLPKGSLMAPGIIKADPAIRFGDEVIILGKNAIGIGKAKMSGVEMNSSSKGIAVLPRHMTHIEKS
ncbi:MAG: archaeosine synthase subunit alpha [Methanimicrococcus sp.]|nr:archaeosine synthase subunit alpha [Methanimicrococcus sp.]